MLCCDHSP
jgi:KUP system potassium uptake protein